MPAQTACNAVDIATGRYRKFFVCNRLTSGTAAAFKGDMLNTRPLPIGAPYFDARDLARLAEPINRGWVVQGPLVAEFEREFGKRLGVPHALATSSCTAALHLGVKALGVQPGDEVIVPAFTWVATANCVEYEQAHPVFVDIDLDTFNIDLTQIPDAFTPRTVGMIPVHLFGLPVDCNALMTIAKRHNIWVLEDAACGFDAKWNGEPVGTFGDAGCFSFHPRKAITTGEGGMLVTWREDVANAVSSLRSHGLELDPKLGTSSLGRVPTLGFNYRLTDIQAALGCTQLAKADEIMAHRRQVAAWYDEALRGIDVLRVAPRNENAQHGWQSYVCLVLPDSTRRGDIAMAGRIRNALIDGLAAQEIGTRPGTHAPAHLEYYANKYGIRPEDYPNAWIAERCSIALPMGAGMTQDDVVRVRDAIVGTLARHGLRQAA